MDKERLEPVKIASVVGIAAILVTLIFLILPRSMRRKVKILFRKHPTGACLPISRSKKRQDND